MTAKEKQFQIEKIIHTVFFQSKHESLHYVTIEIIRLLQSCNFKPALIEKDMYHSTIRVNSRNYRIFRDENNRLSYLIN